MCLAVVALDAHPELKWLGLPVKIIVLVIAGIVALSNMYLIVPLTIALGVALLCFGGKIELLADIENVLNLIDSDWGTIQQVGFPYFGTLVNVSCARLIRVDFIAAGDLLNWVLIKRGESRMVQFVDAHRLVALFFGAMGINEHAKVQVRKV